MYKVASVLVNVVCGVGGFIVGGAAGAIGAVLLVAAVGYKRGK